MAPEIVAEDATTTTKKNDPVRMIPMIDQSQHDLSVRKRDSENTAEKSAELATEEALEAMDKNSDFFSNNPGRELPSFKSEGECIRT